MAGPNVLTLNADLRVPEQVLTDKRVRELFDFDQPIGILLICLLHCPWDEEDPWGVVRRFRDSVAPGSYLAISHLINEGDHRKAAEALFEMSQKWRWPLISRSREDVARYFDGFDRGAYCGGWRRISSVRGRQEGRLEPSMVSTRGVQREADRCAHSAARTAPHDASAQLASWRWPP